MMKGHVRQRNGRWQAIVYLGRDPVTAQQQSRSATFGTQREADAWCARQIVAIADGQGVQTRAIDLDHLITDWLDHLTARDASPATLSVYRYFYKRYVKQPLGSVRLDKLDARSLDRLYGDLKRGGGVDGKPLSAATVRKVHVILSSALEQACRWQWITKNPAKTATPPRHRLPEIEPPTAAEVVKLLLSIEAHDPLLLLFVRLAAVTGARRGELCALRWRHVNLDTKHVEIVDAVTVGDNGAEIKRTKNEGIRRVALDGDTVAMLRSHRAKRRRTFAAVGRTLHQDDFIFSSRVNPNVPWHPLAATGAFRRQRNAAGLQHVRLHDLRHFVATQLLAAGVPLRNVAGRLGHQTMSMVARYGHWIPSTDGHAAQVMGSLLPFTTDADGDVDADDRDHAGDVHDTDRGV